MSSLTSSPTDETSPQPPARIRWREKGTNVYRPVLYSRGGPGAELVDCARRLAREAPSAWVVVGFFPWEPGGEHRYWVGYHWKDGVGPIHLMPGAVADAVRERLLKG